MNVLVCGFDLGCLNHTKNILNLRIFDSESKIESWCLFIKYYIWKKNKNSINSITDLKDFLARKKREREEKSSSSLGSTFLENLENRNSPSKTTQLVGMFPSPTTKLEDDSERLAMEQCATDSCNAVNNKGI